MIESSEPNSDTSSLQLSAPLVRHYAPLAYTRCEARMCLRCWLQEFEDLMLWWADDDGFEQSLES